MPGRLPGHRQPACQPACRFPRSGLLSGTPRAAGFYNINLTIADGTDTVYRVAGLNISAVQIASPGLLPNATQNGSYNYTLTAGGGTGPYSFAIAGAQPPNGLSLTSSGVIAGSVNAGQGKYGFKVTGYRFPEQFLYQGHV